MEQTAYGQLILEKRLDCRHAVKLDFGQCVRQLKDDLYHSNYARIEVRSGAIMFRRFLPAWQISIVDGCLQILTPEGRIDTFLQMEQTGMDEICTTAIWGDQYHFEWKKPGLTTSLEVWLRQEWL